MTAPGNNFIEIILSLAFVILSSYAIGRIQQWYKYGLERDGAYREGYDQASRSMFDMATVHRSSHPEARTPAARPRPSTLPSATEAHPLPPSYPPVVFGPRRVFASMASVGLSRRRIQASSSSKSRQTRRHAA